MYIFGGVSDTDLTLGDLWKLDLSSNSWTEIKKQSSDQWPIARCNHSMVTISDKILLFGGSQGVGKEMNDLHTFSEASNSWVLAFGK